MNKIKILTYTIIILVIVNIFTIGRLFFGNKNERHRQKPKEKIIEKLHFNDNQIDQYESIIEIHRKKIDSIDDQTKRIKNELYLFLTQKENKNVQDSLINSIAKNQIEIEQIHFKHFIDIKKICMPNQLVRYNELTSEFATIFAKPRKR